ncbi:hypothetical protein NCCP2716_04770 [Sporosarcina sp. NCCP-2716]|uniref:YpoC family protein n=1 Tax=Sporosarcina sp. NCCP-2716 TaxID=2943679 RepID=UPI00203CFF35|nr:hypothetical protein [Sporosarcina sp. NCCP-2716]GKV67979.1 hypothetical protein NCCP2716_04770 [Sporosarcina sp. NCCP-2716]
MSLEDTKITKERLAPYFEQWASCKPEIQEKYDRKDASVHEDMTDAIGRYEILLGICAMAGGSDRRTRLEPLNGKERLQFVKDKIASPFALIQLDGLYIELQKKAARYTAR